MIRRIMMLTAALVTCQAAFTVAAQEQSGSTPASVPVAEPVRVSVEDAYRREHAFLQAQKRELQTSLARTQGDFERSRSELERELSQLESRLLGARAAADQIAQQVVQAEEQTISNEENTGLLAATYEQAGSTLAGLGVDLSARGDQHSDDVRLEQLFTAGVQTLGRLSGLRREPGVFFLADGAEVQGQILHYGNVAAFGLSDQGSGALAPAGAGRYKLWPQSDAGTAQALADGRTPEVLHAYVYESLNADATPPKVKSVVDTINSGGTIGWIIVALGLLALVFILLRALFLRSAGASTERVMQAVTPLVQQSRFDDAIQAAKRNKGSSARVVTAALRNIDRDPDHLEDIVSESILHEAGRLNRFGAIILVIAAVAPLLGLLGTVTGMIETFDIITDFGTGDPKLLSGGIAIALVTTQLGLIVAIPLLLIGNLLSGWSERIKDDIERAALRVTNLAKEERGAVA